MTDSLLDPLSALTVLLGVGAVFGLQYGMSQQSHRARNAGQILLGLSVGVLLFRWVSGVMALPPSVRPSWFADESLRTDALALWRCGSLMVVCGIGSVSALMATLESTGRTRLRAFVVVAACGATALAIAAAWDWLLLWLALLAIGARMALASIGWQDRCAGPNARANSTEPIIGLLSAAACLALLLGVWQHVVDYETQRTTRSPRYSAWPRPTALRDAWERTHWIAKTGDPSAAERVAAAANREQRIACGLSALICVVVVGATWSARPGNPQAEDDHAN